MVYFCTEIRKIEQIYQLQIKIISIYSQEVLQKDTSTCLTFAWEHLQWAKTKDSFHESLVSLINKNDDQQGKVYSRFFMMQAHPEVQFENNPSFCNIHWIHHRALLQNPTDWGAFFINTQQLPAPKFLKKGLKKWIIDLENKGELARWNIRIFYRHHHLLETLENNIPLSEDQFIVDYICKLHHKTVNDLGIVLRKAVASGALLQVQSLLTLSQVHVNEIPISGKTALDRANELPDTCSTKKQIQESLLKVGAISGGNLTLLSNRTSQHQASTMTFGPTA